MDNERFCCPAQHEKRVYDTMGGNSSASQRTGLMGKVCDKELRLCAEV